MERQKAELSEVAYTVWSRKTGTSLETLEKHTAVDKVSNGKVLKA